MKPYFSPKISFVVCIYLFRQKKDSAQFDISFNFKYNTNVKEKDLINLSYTEIIKYVATDIGTRVTDRLSDYEYADEYVSDTDIDEMIIERIDDWNYYLKKLGSQINETLLFGKLSKDGFKKDVLKTVFNDFHFESNDSTSWAYDVFPDKPEY